MTLYERLGGEAAIDAAVDLLYQKILSDGRINDFFQGVDMDTVRRMQKAFLTMAFGGPNNHSGREMREIHGHLVASGLNDTHFDAVAENINGTLKELGVPDDLISEVMGAAESLRNEVLNK